MLAVAVARSSSDDIAIRYLLTVLWMTYIYCIYTIYTLYIIGEAKVTPIGRILKVIHQGGNTGAKSYAYDCPV